MIKDPPAHAGAVGDVGSVTGLGEDPLEEGMAGFLPGKAHGQRSLVGYSPWVAESGRRLSRRSRTQAHGEVSARRCFQALRAAALHGSLAAPRYQEPLLGKRLVFTYKNNPGIS